MSYENLAAPFMLDIVGPTCTGKSWLALQMALVKGETAAEIICLDSRTLYEGMDIGTAKPGMAERALIPHHLLDLAEPTTRMEPQAFQETAVVAIEDILDRGKLPILVGGAGLFRHLVLRELAFSPAHRRSQLALMTTVQLKERLDTLGIHKPFNVDDRESLERYISTYPVRQRNGLGLGALTLGLEVEPSQLKTGIASRTAEMLDAGLEQEVRGLVDAYGWSNVLSTTIGYREFRPYFEDRSYGIDRVAGNITANTIRLANRQRAWFRAEPDVYWVSRS